MKAALYARVSTDDKGQNTEVQLDSLRAWCQREGWELFREYVDEASAADFVKRKDWAQLMKDASLRKFDLVLVWDLTRAFRRVSDGVNCMDTLKTYGIGFKTLKNPEIDSTSPMAGLLRNILLAVGEFERTFLVTRVNEGLDYARRHGTKSGRPFGRPRKSLSFQKVLEAWQASQGNYTKAAEFIGGGMKPGTFWNRVAELARKLKTTPKDLLDMDAGKLKELLHG